MTTALIAPRTITRGLVAAMERDLAEMRQVDLPLIHRFTPGLYAREIFMPRGTLVISKIHKTEHPYAVLTGRVSVWTEADGIVHLQAGFVGITRPGTQRVLYIHEDCRWVTFHPTTETDVDRIEAAIIDKPSQAFAVPAAVVKQLQEANVL